MKLSIEGYTDGRSNLVQHLSSFQALVIEEVLNHIEDAATIHYGMLIINFAPGAARGAVYKKLTEDGG